jgi:hypothetical protein
MSRSIHKRTCASVDTSLPDDERLTRIPVGARRGRALGAWAAALCYSSQHELDGFCPTKALQAFAGDEVIQDLLDVGLVVRGQRDALVGVVLVNYAEDIKRVPWSVQRLVAGAMSDDALAKDGRRAS